MGAPPARITAADFLTPPELRHLRLGASEAGRVGGVRLELLPHGAGAALGVCYQQVPLRVLPPFAFPGDQPALVYLLNPTAGLMDGDGHLVELTARAGARALVVGQSATRIHPCLNGFSTQQWHIKVEAGAVLAVLPGPSIPFRGARYYQRAVVDLEPGAAFVWGDVGLAGRYARGARSERFAFATLVQEMTVRRGEQLVFRDRFCWQGPWDEATAAWHFGGGSAWGSVFVTGPLGNEAAPQGGAVFPTPWGDTCVRWVGESEPVIAGVVQTALSVAARRAGRGDTWFSGGTLAPAHWFSSGCPEAGRRTEPSG